MRVLLTNNSLVPRAGSELYVYDVAVELLKRGHEPVAFSPHLGDVAALLRAAAVPVVDDLDRISSPPDVIHGQHHYDTLIAVLRFPDTPAINFCHGWAPIEEEPLLHPSVLRYVAVDEVCRERLELEHGIDPSRVRVIMNFIDPVRFQPREPLPPRPRRALLFDNSFTEASCAPLRQACEDAGIHLDVHGLAAGRATSTPEHLLREYDVVFAKARAALEAMAVGTAVILCGPRGLGPMVTSEQWERLRPLNFGVRTLTGAITKENVRRELDRFQPLDAAQVSARVRREATLASAVDQMTALYDEVVVEARTALIDGEPQRAASSYLRRYAAIYKGRALALAQHDERFAEALRKAERLNSSEANLARATAERATLASRCADLEHQLAQAAEELRSVRDSATWRIARTVLENPLVRGFSPLLDRLGRSLRGG
jgi:hypothetical protein